MKEYKISTYIGVYIYEDFIKFNETYKAGITPEQIEKNLHQSHITLDFDIKLNPTEALKYLSDLALLDTWEYSISVYENRIEVRTR